MMSSSTRPICLLLATLAALLVVCSPTAFAQSSSSSASAAPAACFTCAVTACSAFNNGIAPQLSIGLPSAALAAAECATLNQDIGGFIVTAQNASCAASVASLACDVISLVNQTEVACNTSGIAVGTPLGNQTVFEQRCAAAVPCLGFTFQDEIAGGGACTSFETFLGALVAQPTPSAVPCAPCNISACYGLSTIGITDVTFFTGSLPGINGSACAAQQAVAANLLANGLATVPAAVVQAAVCNPLAALTTVDTQAACAAGEVDNFFDGVLFSASTAVNQTWATFCPPFLAATFDATLVSRLIASGYCVSPAAGLSVYTEQFLLSAAPTGSAPPSLSSSSPSSAPAALSSALSAAASSSSSGGAASAATSAAASSSAATAPAPTPSTGSSASPVVTPTAATAPSSSTATPFAPSSSTTPSESSSSRLVPVLPSSSTASASGGGGGVVLSNAAASGVSPAALVATMALAAAALLV